MEFIKNLYDGNIDINAINTYISNTFIKWLPFIIIYGVIFHVSLWFIFKKEELKPWYSIIPFYDLYLFFKIIGLPYILVFIPFINVITFALMPYNLAREYNCKEWMKLLSILVPFIIIPYIAFSNLQNRNKKIKFDYLQYYKDVDSLEDKLKIITDDNYIIDDGKAIPFKKDNKDVKSKQSEYVDSLVFTKSDDEYVEDEEHIEYKESRVSEIKAKPEEELVDLEDDNNQLDLHEIDDLDNDSKISSNTEVKIEQDIKDYEKVGPSVTAIAFGGKDEHENMTEAKKKEHKCPYCNSDLAGSNGTCPGCGKDVSSLVFETVNLDKLKK